MKKTSYLYVFLFLTICFSSCYEETKVLVKSEFQATVQNNNYTAPVSVTIQNNTTGAEFYKWSFEGGNPSSSNKQHPGSVIYNQSGTYTITLEAWNNNEKDFKEFTFSVDSAVHIAFNTEVLVNNFAPATVKLTNLTTGASTFEWTFEDGNPASSTEQFPENVIFGTPGDHKIRLTVNNGRESFTRTETISLLPNIEVDFDIEPSFNDFDYEAPFTANLINRTQNGLAYEWQSTGGSIADRNAENTQITFISPGTYTITLQGDNRKETKDFSREINIKPNSNLYTLNNIKFGIKNAEETVGCFYSLSDRRLLVQSEIAQTDGTNIDFAFFGLDASFSRCYFLSPSDALSSGFAPISNASQTYFINDLSQTNLSFSTIEFETMVDDTKLRSLNIKDASNTATWFTNVFIPRLVLFETERGIKGAIRIKAFVSEGSESYILTDVKVQKEQVQ